MFKRGDGNIRRFGYHHGFREHIRKEFAAPKACRHCQSTDPCDCGQEWAKLAVESARALPLPSGSLAANRETADIKKIIDKPGPYSSADLLSLCACLESLIRWWKLSRADEATIGQTEATLKSVRLAEETLP